MVNSSYLQNMGVCIYSIIEEYLVVNCFKVSLGHTGSKSKTEDIWQMDIASHRPKSVRVVTAI